MELLLDTHILIWWLTDDKHLSKRARAAVADAARVHVSPVSAWEIEMKKARGRLTAPNNLEATIRAHGMQPLPITIAHGIAAGQLPLLHRDPFDRMLIAQASIESLTLMTADEQIRKYNVPVLMV